MNQRNKKDGFWQILPQALSLNASFYEEARCTLKNLRTARNIAILAAISHALGSTVILLINRATVAGLILGIFLDILSVTSGYYFWTFTIFRIGQYLKPNHITYRELLVPIGFAYAPQVLNFLTLLPLLGRPIELLLSLWSLLAVIVAVRQGLDIKTAWATLICLIGWPFVQMVVGIGQILEQKLT